MNNPRRLVARLIAQYLEDIDTLEEDSYKLLVDVAYRIRQDEWASLKALGSKAKTDPDDPTVVLYHCISMEAFPLLQTAHNELLRAESGDGMDASLVIRSLRKAARADGSNATHAAEEKTKKKKQE